MVPIFNAAQPFAGANPLRPYIAGAALYDQDGHQVALTTSVSYGETVNFSQIAFPRAALRERGITSLRSVVHDTYNGYLLGFLNIA